MWEKERKEQEMLESDLITRRHSSPRRLAGFYVKNLILFLVLSRQPNGIASKTADFIVSVGEHGRREQNKILSIRIFVV